MVANRIRQSIGESHFASAVEAVMLQENPLLPDAKLGSRNILRECFSAPPSAPWEIAADPRQRRCRGRIPRCPAHLRQATPLSLSSALPRSWNGGTSSCMESDHSGRRTLDCLLARFLLPVRILSCRFRILPIRRLSRAVILPWITSCQDRPGIRFHARRCTAVVLGS